MDTHKMILEFLHHTPQIMQPGSFYTWDLWNVFKVCLLKQETHNKFPKNIYGMLTVAELQYNRH